MGKNSKERRKVTTETESRILDLSVILTDFEGKPFEEDDKILNMRYFLLRYLRHTHAMGLTEKQADHAYTLGMLVGGAHPELPGEIEIDKDHYTTLKKICDHGKVSGHTPKGDRVVDHLFPAEQYGAIRRYIDKLPNVGDPMPAKA